MKHMVYIYKLSNNNNNCKEIVNGGADDDWLISLAEN